MTPVEETATLPESVLSAGSKSRAAFEVAFCAQMAGLSDYKGL